jgi:hypothetical protein
MEHYKNLSLEDIEGEIWMKIPSYNNYYVSNLGSIKNIKTKNKLKGTVRGIPPKNYLFVQLSENNKQKFFFVHTLVMLAFVGTKLKGIVINHINGDKGDNRLCNLEYCTQSYNRKQDFIKGRQSLSGEKNTQAKLNESDVLKILELRRLGNTYLEMSKKYKVAVSCIQRIINGKGWVHVAR